MRPPTVLGWRERPSWPLPILAVWHSYPPRVRAVASRGSWRFGFPSSSSSRSGGTQLLRPLQMRTGGAAIRDSLPSLPSTIDESHPCARSLSLCLSLSVCLSLLPLSLSLSLILHLHYADRATLAFDVRFFVLQRTSLRFFDCVSVDWQRTPLMSCMQFVVLPTQGRTMSSKRCVQNPACTFRQATFLPLHTQTTFFILHTQFAMLLPQSNQYFRALAWACQGNCDKYSLEQKSSCKSW